MPSVGWARLLRFEWLASRCDCCASTWMLSQDQTGWCCCYGPISAFRAYGGTGIDILVLIGTGAMYPEGLSMNALTFRSA